MCSIRTNGRKLQDPAEEVRHPGDCEDASKLILDKLILYFYLTYHSAHGD